MQTEFLSIGPTPALTGRATHIAPDTEVNDTLAIHVMGNYIRGVRDDAPRLRLDSDLPVEVKEWVDPEGLFWCFHCVGSELWSDDGLCRVQ